MNEVTYQPAERGIYMFNAQHAGSSLVYVQTHKDYHEFIFLPGPSKFLIAFQEFTKAIKTKVLELAEDLPDEIYNETIKCYKQNIK